MTRGERIDPAVLLSGLTPNKTARVEEQAEEGSEGMTRGEDRPRGRSLSGAMPTTRDEGNRIMSRINHAKQHTAVMRQAETEESILAIIRDRRRGINPPGGAMTAIRGIVEELSRDDARQLCLDLASALLTEKA